MFLNAYRRAASILARRPIKLWGLSLLSGIVCLFACLLTAPSLGIVGIGFSMVVTAGMSKIYLDALEGKEINSDQLFCGFKRMWTVLGGVAWKSLWIFIWTFGTIAVVGVVYLLFLALGYCLRAAAIFSLIGAVFAVILAVCGIVVIVVKTYSYRFVEYILMTREDVSATEALRLSMRLTRGKRGQMFAADLVFVIAASVIGAVLALLAMIPYVGSVFAVILLAFELAIFLFSGIFQGLYTAAFYRMPEVLYSAEGEFDAKVEQFSDLLTEEPREEAPAPQEEPAAPQEETPAPQEEPSAPQEEVPAPQDETPAPQEPEETQE